MQYITYWELNENLSVEARLEVSRKLSHPDMFPPDNVEIVRWGITPHEWGILILEAEDEDELQRSLKRWHRVGRELFETTKTAPLLPVHQQKE